MSAHCRPCSLRFLSFLLLDALSLEPAGTAKRRMKVGRGHVCKNESYILSEPINSAGCLTMSLSGPVRRSSRRIRLIGDDMLKIHFSTYIFLLRVYSLSEHLDVALTLPFRTVCTRPGFCSHRCTKRAKVETSEEASGEES